LYVTNELQRFYQRIAQLKQYSVPIIAGKDSPKVTKTPEHGSTWKLGDSITIKALHTPCHTQDSICYFFEDGNDRAVFTGDTLFIAGIAFTIGLLCSS
jgi:hydroxyacylglutathione hydrolase